MHVSVESNKEILQLLANKYLESRSLPAKTSFKKYITGRTALEIEIDADNWSILEMLEMLHQYLDKKAYLWQV